MKCVCVPGGRPAGPALMGWSGRVGLRLIYNHLSIPHSLQYSDPAGALTFQTLESIIPGLLAGSVDDGVENPATMTIRACRDRKYRGINQEQSQKCKSGEEEANAGAAEGLLQSHGFRERSGVVTPGRLPFAACGWLIAFLNPLGQ